MKVQEVMTKEVVSVTPETPVSEVADIMFRQRFHGVPVLSQNRLVGIVTETDFYTKDTNIFLPSFIDFIANQKMAGSIDAEKKQSLDRIFRMTVGDIMTSECVTVSPESSLEELVAMFQETKFVTFPVVDEQGGLVGIITQTDIINLIGAGKIAYEGL